MLTGSSCAHEKLTHCAASRLHSTAEEQTLLHDTDTFSQEDITIGSIAALLALQTAHECEWGQLRTAQGRQSGASWQALGFLDSSTMQACCTDCLTAPAHLPLIPITGIHVILSGLTA